MFYNVQFSPYVTLETESDLVLLLVQTPHQIYRGKQEVCTIVMLYTMSCIQVESLAMLTGRSILQPTPLVQALTNQLVSSLNRNAGEKQQEAKTGHVDNVKHVVNLVGSKSKSTRSPIVQRGRAHSKPKSSDAPLRPPPPTHPPPPNPRLSRLINQYQATSSGVHVIDSRSKSKTLPSRRSTVSAAKTTKHGTLPPTRPAPPPPKATGKGKEQGKDPPKFQTLPVPKPQSSSLPRLTNAGNFNQDSASTSKVKKNATKEVVDQSFPVYEDLDKDDNNYEILDPSSSSEDENERTINTRDDPSTNSDAPPPIPPKKGSKIERHKKEEELPPLPPRTRPATTVKKHRLLTNHNPCEVPKEKDSEEEDEEALQDTGVYEPVIYRGSDEESQKSQGYSVAYNYVTML